MDQFLKKSQPSAVEWPPNSGIFTLFLKAQVLLNGLKLPNIQRELDNNHIDDLYEKFIMEHRQLGYFNFGLFDLCYYDNTLYLLNGQHRYAVLQRVQLKYPNISVQVKIKQTNTEEEMNHYFRIVNDSKQSIIVKNSNHQVILNSFRRHLTQNYQDFLVKSKKPHKPNINLDNLMEKIDEINLIERLNITEPNTLITMVEKINNYYRSIQYEDCIWKAWKIPDVTTLLEKTRNRSLMKPLFLGIYPQFEWLERIIKHQTEGIAYECMPHYWKTYKTRKISQKRRSQVWRKHNQGMDGSCFVCSQNINYENFECGHVTAVFWGGNSLPTNLEPICGSCNKDMGVENLYEYKNREYGSN